MQKALKPSHVRIKVICAALNPVDHTISEAGAMWFYRSPTPESPFVVGVDAAGIIVEVGSDFKVSDDVFTCRSIDDFGTVAEYISVEAQFVAPKPKSQTFKDAAGVPLAALVSYQALFTHVTLQASQRVLVIGGSSATGSFAVQLAKSAGAHVTATTSQKNVDFVKSLGADCVIDYTTEKWGEILQEHSVDVIYNCGFESQTWNDVAQKILKKDTGAFITLTKTENKIEPPIGAKFFYIYYSPSGKDLREITKFIEKDQVKSFVDSVYPLESALEAINKVKGVRAVGKVIILVAQE